MKLAGIEPRRVMYYFEKISEIPRESGNEQDISNYLVAFATVHKLEYYQDDNYNVIIKKEGTPGYEKSPIVALQAHIDMVCVQEKGTEHNFEREGIDLIVDEDTITANMTTLGADNGLGVAYMLAILESDKLEHSKIEAIFTSDEEVGMSGAKSLDFSKIDSKLLINLDSEDEGIITVGCAGGARIKTEIMLDSKRKTDFSQYILYSLSVKGLTGGHSGVNINEDRCNAIKLIANMTKEIFDTFSDSRIIYIDGGERDNVIPRDAQVCIMIKKEEKDSSEQLIKELVSQYTQENEAKEPEIRISYDKMKIMQLKENPLTNRESKQVIEILNEMHNGVYTMSEDVTGLVESSANIGVVKTKENEVEIEYLMRSSNEDKLEQLIEKVKSMVDDNANMNFKMAARYPAWEYDKTSDLRKFAVKCFIDMYGRTPEIEIIHAGLECAIFKEKRPDMDMISFGPNIFGAHSPEEYMSVASMQRVWEYLLYLLKKMK